jgi:hypothetical protein
MHASEIIRPVAQHSSWLLNPGTARLPQTSLGPCKDAGHPEGGIPSDEASRMTECLLVVTGEFPPVESFPPVD